MLAYQIEARRHSRPWAACSRLRAATRSSRTLERVRTATRVGRWLLPWISVLILSATIAHALDTTLARTVQEPLMTVASTAVTSNTGCHVRGGAARSIDTDPWITLTSRNGCPLTPAEPGAHWITLGAVEAYGSVTSLNCLARSDRVVPAVLHVPAEDMDAVVSQVCLKTWL